MWGQKGVILPLIVFTIAACSGGEQHQSKKQTPSVSSYSRSSTNERVVVQCQSTCDEVAQEINQLGGKVTLSYRNVPAIAATLSTEQLNTLKASSTVKGLTKDIKIRKPIPQQMAHLKRTYRALPLPVATLATNTISGKHPSDYAFNNELIGVTPLHAQGKFGDGSIVAVIDTGIANVDAIDGSVIGGENFIDQEGEPSATSTANDPHGTMVSTMIAGHAAFLFPNDDDLVQSLLQHSPASVLPYDDTYSAVPMIGTAPAAGLYALKVFAANNDGTDSSIVIAAMDRVLTLKKNFLDGVATTPISGDGSENNPYVYDALDINVVNMSLGGPTTIPGNDLGDLLANKMVELGITVVTAAGNEGPAALTVSSPATATGALSVGASGSATHERIFYDLLDGLGQGDLTRFSDETQVAYFSSRGPTPYGSRGVEVMSNGVANYVQGSDGDIYFVFGTSFSSPAVAGAAALLHSMVPDAKATQIRHALIDNADITKIGDNASSIDQGNGVINVANAYALLSTTTVDDSLPPPPDLNNRPEAVAETLEHAGYTVIDLEDRRRYQQPFDLAPGQSMHLLIDSEADTDTITLQISRIEPQLPSEQQNTLYGDRLRVVALDAPTTMADFLVEEIINKPTSYRLSRPQTGIVRVALSGHRMNAGRIKGVIRLSSKKRDVPRTTISRRIENGQQDVYTLHVDKKISRLDFQLMWQYGWAYTPTMDIDLILVDPNGEPVFDGATLRMPEQVSIDNPTPGDWLVIVDGYELYGFQDRYRLSATDNRGRSLRLQ